MGTPATHLQALPVAFCLGDNKIASEKKTEDKSHTTGRLIRYPCYIPTHSLTPCAALLVTTSKNPMSENHENVGNLYDSLLSGLSVSLFVRL